MDSTAAIVSVTSADFDFIYTSPITSWGNARIPAEIKALARVGSPQCALELGCGAGMFSRWMALEGLAVVGVDFSKVAIEKARKRVENDYIKPLFLVEDVTSLDLLSGPFDFSFDVGCFHCLDENARRKYVLEVFRVLKSGGTHLIWVLDRSPAGLEFSPDIVKEIFAPGFRLEDTKKSRRRLLSSHWYWLVKE